MKLRQSVLLAAGMLIVLLFLPILNIAQVNADSILQQWQKMKSSGEQLTFLDTVCAQLHRSLEKGGDTIFLTRQALSDEGQAGIERALEASDYLIRQFAGEKAVSILQPYLDKEESLSLQQRLAIWEARADIYGEQNQYEPAIDLYQKIIDLSGQQVEPPLEVSADVYRNIGKNLYAVGRFGESSIALNQAKERYLRDKDSTGMKYTLLELAILFSQIGLYDEAAKYVKQRQQFSNPPSPLNNAIDDINLGRNLILQTRYREALMTYHSALAAAPFENGFDFMDLYIYNGIVECQYFLGNRDSVIFYFQEMEKAFDRQGRNEVYQFLYLQSRFLDHLTQKRFAAAEADGAALMESARKNKDGAELMMYAQYLSALYRATGQYDRALEYADLYNAVRDSINTANKTNALLLYQTQYETAEKENQILSLQAEQKVQEAKARVSRNRFIAGILLTVLLAGLLLTRIYYRNKVARARQVEQLRTKISNDLHDDVGSILTGLAMQSEILEGTAQASDKTRLSRITELSRAAQSRMRDAVWAMDAQKDNWQSLLDRMREFAVETLSARDIAFDIESGGLESDQYLSGDFRQQIYLIFKEAITNVVKHSDGNRAALKLEKTPEQFSMTIRDNGNPAEKGYKTSGLGTGSMQKRARQLGGKLRTYYEKGFVVQLEI